ncbi:sphingosine 1-phosphate receptor 1-like [Oculina patagonica]
MNSSATSLSGMIPTECEMYHFLGGKLDNTTTEANAVLVFLIVVSIITCPFAILLNVLVIVAVKTKHQLKTNSNIVLGCLAVTDALIGGIAQPMFIATRILTLQGDTSKKYCFLSDHLTRNVLRLLCSASGFHLVLLMSGERYLAIKHSFAYTTMVTKARIFASSAAAWITVVVLTIPSVITDNEIYLTIHNIIFAVVLAIITLCQALVYAETRRHERQIAAQQMSLEARQKFLKEKKALKITTSVIFILLLSYSPLFVVRILLVTSNITSVNMAYISFYTASVLTILNSFMNRIIYCVRMRQFRVAFIEILLRKNYVQAEQFERRMFGTSNNEAPLEARQDSEGAQNDEQGNRNDNNNEQTTAT